MNTNAKIFVTGHRGMVGSAIVRRLQAGGYDNLLTRTHAELDLLDQRAVHAFLANEKPDYLFIAAAKVGGIQANNQYRADFLYQKIVAVNNVNWASLGRMEGKDVISSEGNLPLTALWSVLGLPAPATPSERLNVVVLERGELRQAIEVERLEEEREVTVHPLGDRFPGARQLLGAAFLSGGRIAPILDPLGLMQRARTVTSPAPATGPVARRARRVLLADDSPTTRTLERLILESHGYEVRVAVDGAEAWELLQHHAVDVVVSDVEMPGMTGLELTRAIRASQRLAGLPVVLVTGLANETDRRRGLEAGANGYVVKTAFDQKDLLDIIEQLL